MNKVTFDILVNLKNAASDGLIQIKKQLDGISSGSLQAGSMSDRMGAVLSNLRAPNLNAILEVTEKLGQSLKEMTAGGVAFGQGMADLSSITGITGDELAQLEETSRKVGKDSGMGALAASHAYTVLASQIDVAKIGMVGLNTLQKESVLLAQASGMGLEGSAIAVAGTINQFGLAASEANRVVNVLGAGAKYGAAEIEDLSMSFKVVGTAASAMGLTVESTAGALEVLSKANLKGSEAGTALRNIILKLNTELGVDLSTTSLSTALESLQPKLTDATYLSKMFGMENIAAAQFLIKNASAVDEMTAKVTGTNVAQEQAAIRTQTTAQKIAVMQAKVDDLKISITQSLGGFAAYATVVGDNAMQFAALFMIGNQMVPMFTGVWSMVKAITTSQLALSIATKAWTAAQYLLNIALTANPIGLIVMAIAGLVAAVVLAYNKCEWFKNLVDGAWVVLKKLGTIIADEVVTRFMGLVGAVGAAGRAIWNFITGDFEGAMAAAKESADALGVAVLGASGKTSDAVSVQARKDAVAMDTANMSAVNYIGTIEKFNGYQPKSVAVSTVVPPKPKTTVEPKGPQTIKEYEDAITALNTKLEQTADRGAAMKISSKIVELKRAKDALEQAYSGKLTEVQKVQITAETWLADQVVDRFTDRLKNRDMTVTVPVQFSEYRLPDLPDFDEEIPGQKLTYTLKLRLEGLERAKEQLEQLKELYKVANTPEERAELKKMIGGLEQYTSKLNTAKTSQEKTTDGLSAMGQFLGNISGMVNSSAGAWLNYGANLLSVIAQSIPSIIAMMTVKTADTVVTNANTSANVANAASKVMAAHSGIPFVGIALGLAGVAAIAGAMLSLPKFADGGIAYGPTLGLFGEYSGAANNPEVVAPLSKLKSLIAPQGGVGGEVEFRIEGRTLVGMLNKMNRINNRNV